MTERVPAASWCLLAAVILLPVGSLGGGAWAVVAASGAVVLSAALQWRHLLPLARVLLGLGAAGAAGLLITGQWPALLAALAQGAGFAALMAVLGFLRHPVRKSRLIAQATQALLSVPPSRRYGATYAGTHLLALMFNVGIIAMISDLTAGSRARPTLVMAAMRGAATVAMWSPLGLGFAIVSGALPAFQALPFLAVSAAFTALALAVTTVWPLLPRTLPQAGAVPAIASGAMWQVVGLSAILLAAAVLLHLGLDIGFTVASIILLPLLSLGWMAVQGRLSETPTALAGLTGLRNEGTIFLSASIIGTVLSQLVGQTAFPALLTSGALPMLPILLLTMAVIPLTAAAYIPNSVFVVMVAQLLGPKPIGFEHPLALGLALSVSWTTAISVSPISAMCLMAGAACGVPSRVVAHRWNAPWAAALAGLGMLAVTALMLC
ncbi:hypothetical protein [Paracoccus shanxieyensis]|uniref:Uncharacterized protein n=1 Tax=Paracoccus shanxieyensis TaxID=2675752 RepID=A0A6L6IVU5_9RHOB|nr:hypothetical protein [Paracoccus shanxieyensis]MTH64009.1 hypothetical protein [Paracoccus shanxieyensis]MTH86950.1 hypothetical protein [Paracoccus shanxieyensis]